MESLPSALDNKQRITALARSGDLGLIVDFDGTISEVAPRPSEAVVSERAARSLRRLVHQIALVAVVSGRSVKDLRSKVGEAELTYVGNHGVEFLDDSGLWEAPGAAEYRGRILRLVEYLKARVDEPGLVWEEKGYGVSIHYRLATDPDQVHQDLSGALSSAPGSKVLESFWGKMVLEIRSPQGLGKGFAVRRLASLRRLSAMIVIGDDTTDVEAIDAMVRLRAHGKLDGLGIAVYHPDAPAELLNAADFLLDGVSEVEEFLEWMAESTGPVAGGR